MTLIVLGNSGKMTLRCDIVIEIDKDSILEHFVTAFSINLLINFGLQSIILKFLTYFDLFMTFIAFLYCVSSPTFLNSRCLIIFLPSVKELKCLLTRFKLLRKVWKLEILNLIKFNSTQGIIFQFPHLVNMSLFSI